MFHSMMPSHKDNFLNPSYVCDYITLNSDGMYTLIQHLSRNRGVFHEDLC